MLRAKCVHGLCILYMLLSDVPLSDQCRFKPAKTAAANPMPELGTSVVRGLSSMLLKAIFVLKNAQLPTTCTYLDDPPPHICSPQIGKSTLAETCQKKTFKCHLTKKVGRSQHQLSGAMQPVSRKRLKPSPRNEPVISSHPSGRPKQRRNEKGPIAYSITRRSTPAVDASMTWDIPTLKSLMHHWNSKAG